MNEKSEKNLTESDKQNILAIHYYELSDAASRLCKNFADLSEEQADELMISIYAFGENHKITQQILNKLSPKYDDDEPEGSFADLSEGMRDLLDHN